MANAVLLDEYATQCGIDLRCAWSSAASSLALSNGHGAEYVAALGLAFTGDAAGLTQVEKLADDLAKRFPQDTLVQSICLPTIRGQLALGRNDAQKAIWFLLAASAYELGYPGTSSFSHNLYPVDVREDAYLPTHQVSRRPSNSKRFSTIAAWWATILSHRLPVSGLGALQNLFRHWRCGEVLHLELLFERANRIVIYWHSPKVARGTYSGDSKLRGGGESFCANMIDVFHEAVTRTRCRGSRKLVS